MSVVVGSLSVKGRLAPLWMSATGRCTAHQATPAPATTSRTATSAPSSIFRRRDIAKMVPAGDPPACRSDYGWRVPQDAWLAARDGVFQATRAAELRLVDACVRTIVAPEVALTS